MFALTGDLDYYNKILGLPNYSSAAGPCSHCQCKKAGDDTWTDFRATASWRATKWTPSAWRAWEEHSRCPLLSLPGASCWTVAYDWMHVKYLGTDMYQYGSVLAFLCHTVMANEPEQNLSQCWTFLKQFFKDHGTPSPFRYLNRLSMFVRQGGRFPKLRGKAAEVRHFGAALHALWNAHMNPHLILHRRINLMLQLNCQLENMITEYKDDFAFPPGPAEDFDNTCTTMLQLQTQVAEHFLEEGIAYFDVTSKCHMLQELAILARHINPRLIWVFAGKT